jgi:carboxypeptidase C (cathepsin A)
VAEPEVPGRRELRHHPGGRLAEHLLENQGIALNGVILISAVLDFATIRFGEGNETPYPLFLPTYTAAAHYHKKLQPDCRPTCPRR